MTKTLYELPIPRTDNAGRPLAKARGRFLSTVARIVGGYTLHADARGMWCDHGRAYHDTMTPLDFAASYPQARQIVRVFHLSFPDQLATMLTERGNVQTVRFLK